MDRQYPAGGVLVQVRAQFGDHQGDVFRLLRLEPDLPGQGLGLAPRGGDVSGTGNVEDLFVVFRRGGGGKASRQRVHLRMVMVVPSPIRLSTTISSISRLVPGRPMPIEREVV